MIRHLVGAASATRHVASTGCDVLDCVAGILTPLRKALLCCSEVGCAVLHCSARQQVI